jgi:DNA-binding NtrC family response regulator
VHSPPLRQREGDVTFLARHFLKRCSAQYGRQIDGFTPAAEEVLLRYPWPGNIRELRNKLIRAVILCQGNRIDVAELGLRRESDRRAAPRQPEPARPATGSAPEPGGPGEPIDELEGSLREAMAALVGQCLGCHRLVPLSQWLEQDLILAALELHGQVNLQAADALGIPESTLRRKLSRFRSSRTQRPTELQTEWQAVTAILPGWIQAAQQEGFDPMRNAQNLLLREIDKQANSQVEAATLVGVTPPTYRRQINQLANW